MGPTTFFHRDYNFGYLERVAVIPLENLSSDQGAAFRATRILVTEILSTDAFEVVEPGETARVLAKFGTVRTGELAQEELTSIGKELGVQGLFLGSVDESSTLRSGSSNVNVVTMTLRLVETDTGATVWSATHSEGGRGFWSTALGTGDRSMGEVTRACVAQILGTLVK
jgi:TolB-like protein